MSKRFTSENRARLQRRNVRLKAMLTRHVGVSRAVLAGSTLEELNNMALRAFAADEAERPRKRRERPQ